MHSRSHPISYLSLALAVATALTSTCRAQEVASIDLTSVMARLDLRRPEATAPLAGRYYGTEQRSGCLDSTHKVGELHTSLVSLDRTHYQIQDKPTFEVTVENAGSTPVRIPFSPHLSDLQPKNPAQKFAYSKLEITLWIAAEDGQWSTNTGGSVVLYGDDNHAGTMLSLKPGQWVRIVGTGMFSDPRNGLSDEFIRLHPAGRVYANAALYRGQTLITPTQSATVTREVCIEQTHAQTVPIQLAIP